MIEFRTLKNMKNAYSLFKFKQMKKILYSLMLCSLIGSSCQKIEPDSFCSRERVNRSEFVNVNGVIGYYPSFSSFTVNLPYLVVDSNAINSKRGIIGLPCSLDTAFMKKDMNVIISGELRTLNNDEKFVPPTDSAEILFLIIKSIRKK
jgi:hypothetical protein